MAAALTKRPGRLRALLPPCYHEGFLEKRTLKDKISRKLWTCLCGNALFFFNHSKDNNYVEKLELSGFISLTDDGSRGPKLEAARLNLRLKDGDVKLTAPSLEARELWKGYIYAVVELSIPTYLNLMPGQRLMLKSVIERERERRRPPSPPPSAAASSLYLSVQGDMPACFHSVSRTEAEVLLEKHPGFGNLLLRPGRDGVSLAVTTYQDLNGPVFRHYRLARKPDGGFSIEVENPVACATLSDVIDHLVETTSGVLKPFVMETHYDQSITFVQSNNENGERSLQCASTSSIPKAPSPPPKPGVREHSQEQEPSFEENFYLNDPMNNEEQNFMEHPPTPPPKTVKKALLPYQNSHSPTFTFKDLDSTTTGDIEEKLNRFPTPTPKKVKKALLPKQSPLPTSPSEGQDRMSADSGAFGQHPVPAPRASRSKENPNNNMKKSALTGHPRNTLSDIIPSITEELKQKLELRGGKQ
ncbi:hypothetical protein AGOR_G00145940 [Albula goreensis]|uniref:SH2 domain-containing protein n=1 Tax=Albula goreensis TaxID=1534307 RepID=A0A8T3D9Y8_9TELE|nr:hypothetical protein AGOR_G00145940 [Albula goreensis]